MQRIWLALKTVNYRLWIAILLTLLIPSIYQTIRIFLIGVMPSDQGLNIASQLSWVKLFYEIAQEALILPLFFLLGKSLSSKCDLANKVRTGLLVTFLFYLVISIIIIASAEPLVKLMAQDNALINATVNYVRLETVAMVFTTLLQFLLLVFITMKKDKYLYIILLVQMILSVVLDVFFMSSLNFSLKLGVNGIAITNIIVSFSLVLVCIVILYREEIKIFVHGLDFKWMKEWWKIGKFSGLESLIRNLVFMIMIVRMVNVVAEQGNYWVANTFIWDWLLLPGLALADLIRRDVAENKKNIEYKTFGYLLVISAFCLFWVTTIPAWKPFLQYVMNIEDYELVYQIVLIQSGFYLLFLFNNCVFDSVFYGLGKTQYLLIQSVLINIVYYGLMFILYVTNIFQPDLISISLMFGIGMTLDFIPTIVLYILVLKRENLKICFNKEQLLSFVKTITNEPSCWKEQKIDAHNNLKER